MLASSNPWRPKDQSKFEPDGTIEDTLIMKTANSSGSDAPLQWANRLELAHDSSYYKKCAAGGVLSCGVMHTFITPLDVVKCNLQVNPSKYKSVWSGLQLIMQEEGMRGIWKGWGPTLVGYSFQGATKFGFYEYFKDAYSAAAGPENAYQYRSLIYVAAGGSAEFIADILMCPWEMVSTMV
jgi:solute carrier family 25 phosphate transporter 3